MGSEPSCSGSVISFIMPFIGGGAGVINKQSERRHKGRQTVNWRGVEVTPLMTEGVTHYDEGAMGEEEEGRAVRRL